MKQQAIQYVALDVHQATLVVSVRDEQGSVVMRATVATEATAIVGLVRGLGSRAAHRLRRGDASTVVARRSEAARRLAIPKAIEVNATRSAAGHRRRTGLGMRSREASGVGSRHIGDVVGGIVFKTGPKTDQGRT
jgi:hypothetical protein